MKKQGIVIEILIMMVLLNMQHAILFAKNTNSTVSVEPMQTQSSFQKDMSLKKNTNDFEGLASWYGTEFSGRKTASGELYDPYQFTAAHRSLPFDTILRVTNTVNNKSVLVRITDRGPYGGDRVLDVSHAAAEVLDMLHVGVANVSAHIVKEDELSMNVAVIRHQYDVQAKSRQRKERTENEKQILNTSANIDKKEILNRKSNVILQMGAFNSEENALVLQASLRKAGFESYIDYSNNNVLYRVYIDSVSGDNAKEYQDYLENLGYSVFMRPRYYNIEKTKALQNKQKKVLDTIINFTQTDATLVDAESSVSQMNDKRINDMGIVPIDLFTSPIKSDVNTYEYENDTDASHTTEQLSIDKMSNDTNDVITKKNTTEENGTEDLTTDTNNIDESSNVTEQLPIDEMSNDVDDVMTESNVAEENGIEDFMTESNVAEENGIEDFMNANGIDEQEIENFSNEQSPLNIMREPLVTVGTIHLPKIDDDIPLPPFK